jgi:hypothetical protein
VGAALIRQVRSSAVVAGADAAPVWASMCTGGERCRHRPRPRQGWANPLTRAASGTNARPATVAQPDPRMRARLAPAPVRAGPAGRAPPRATAPARADPPWRRTGTGQASPDSGLGGRLGRPRIPAAPTVGVVAVRPWPRAACGRGRSPAPAAQAKTQPHVGGFGRPTSERSSAHCGPTSPALGKDGPARSASTRARPRRAGAAAPTRAPPAPAQARRAGRLER